MKQYPTLSVCQSVFQGGAASTTSERYTKIWIHLINQMEKAKEALNEVR